MAAVDVDLTTIIQPHKINKTKLAPMTEDSTTSTTGSLSNSAASVRCRSRTVVVQVVFSCRPTATSQSLRSYAAAFASRRAGFQAYWPKPISSGFCGRPSDRQADKRAGWFAHSILLFDRLVVVTDTAIAVAFDVVVNVNVNAIGVRPTVGRRTGGLTRMARADLRTAALVHGEGNRDDDDDDTTRRYTAPGPARPGHATPRHQWVKLGAKTTRGRGHSGRTVSQSVGRLVVRTNE